jgi:hypothetical protein
MMVKENAAPAQILASATSLMPLPRAYKTRLVETKTKIFFATGGSLAL